METPSVPTSGAIRGGGGGGSGGSASAALASAGGTATAGSVTFERIVEEHWSPTRLMVYVCHRVHARGLPRLLVRIEWYLMQARDFAMREPDVQRQNTVVEGGGQISELAGPTGNMLWMLSSVFTYAASNFADVFERDVPVAQYSSTQQYAAALHARFGYAPQPLVQSHAGAQTPQDRGAYAEVAFKAIAVRVMFNPARWGVRMKPPATAWWNMDPSPLFASPVDASVGSVPVDQHDWQTLLNPAARPWERHGFTVPSCEALVGRPMSTHAEEEEEEEKLAAPPPTERAAPSVPSPSREEAEGQRPGGGLGARTLPSGAEEEEEEEEEEKETELELQTCDVCMDRVCIPADVLDVLDEHKRAYTAFRTAQGASVRQAEREYPEVVRQAIAAYKAGAPSQLPDYLLANLGNVYPREALLGWLAAWSEFPVRMDFYRCPGVGEAAMALCPECRVRLQQDYIDKFVARPVQDEQQPRSSIHFPYVPLPMLEHEAEQPHKPHPSSASASATTTRAAPGTQEQEEETQEEMEQQAAIRANRTPLRRFIHPATRMEATSVAPFVFGAQSAVQGTIALPAPYSGYMVPWGWFSLPIGPYALLPGALVYFAAEVEPEPVDTFALGVVIEYDTERFDLLRDQTAADIGVVPTRAVVVPILPFYGENAVCSVRVDEIFPVGVRVPPAYPGFEARRAQQWPFAYIPSEVANLFNPKRPSSLRDPLRVIEDHVLAPGGLMPAGMLIVQTNNADATARAVQVAGGRVLHHFSNSELGIALPHGVAPEDVGATRAKGDARARIAELYLLLNDRQMRFETLSVCVLQARVEAVRMQHLAQREIERGGSSLVLRSAGFVFPAPPQAATHGHGTRGAGGGGGGGGGGGRGGGGGEGEEEEEERETEPAAGLGQVGVVREIERQVPGVARSVRLPTAPRTLPAAPLAPVIRERIAHAAPPHGGRAWPSLSEADRALQVYRVAISRWLADRVTYFFPETVVSVDQVWRYPMPTPTERAAILVASMLGIHTYLLGHEYARDVQHGESPMAWSRRPELQGEDYPRDMHIDMLPRVRQAWDAVFAGVGPPTDPTMYAFPGPEWGGGVDAPARVLASGVLYPPARLYTPGEARRLFRRIDDARVLPHGLGAEAMYTRVLDATTRYTWIIPFGVAPKEVLTSPQVNLNQWWATFAGWNERVLVRVAEGEMDARTEWTRYAPRDVPPDLYGAQVLAHLAAEQRALHVSTGAIAARCLAEETATPSGLGASTGAGAGAGAPAPGPLVVLAERDPDLAAQRWYLSYNTLLHAPFPPLVRVMTQPTLFFDPLADRWDLATLGQVRTSPVAAASVPAADVPITPAQARLLVFVPGTDDMVLRLPDRVPANLLQLWERAASAGPSTPLLPATAKRGRAAVSPQRTQTRVQRPRYGLPAARSPTRTMATIPAALAHGSRFSASPSGGGVLRGG